MKHIDVRIECSDQFQVFVHDVLLAVEKEYPVTAQITVTELPPQQDGDWRNELANELENSLDEIIHEVSPAERYRIADIIRNWQPAAPVAPAVETEMGMTPSTKAFLKKAGVKVKTVDDVFLKNILANSGNNPQPPCPSCEKLRAENAELNTQRNNAEIQLVAIIQAVSGFTKTKPKMTIGEFEKYLSKICKFAREAEKEEFERKIRLNQPKGEGDIK